MSSSQELLDLKIPLQELSDATNAFSEQNLIARGGFGKVYRGVSEKHGKMAIKMLDLRQGEGRDQGDPKFETEIALLSVYKHEHIVSLVGFCDEDGHKILVYRYESKGSLDQHLDSPDLNWIHRLKICLEAACGLQYLHDNVRIIHRDIKSSNILFDESHKAKVSDFGFSKMGPENMRSNLFISSACGTIGYIDPDYLNTGYLTQKSDVYSFGVVLFEVMCGRLSRVTKYNDEREFLTNLVKIHWGSNTLDEIICPHILGEMNSSAFLTFSNIAYQCLMSENERPTMTKVAEQLQKACMHQITMFGKDGDRMLAPGTWKYVTGSLKLKSVSSGTYDGDHFAAHHQGQLGLSQTSSSSSPSWKYDVFISFRGEDTRKTFVDHLFWTLEDRQIITYKDDELLPRGEAIGPSLFKAIQESRIAIIVFSQNYATSSWCLDELAFIMKNKDERGQTVIPIFYGVEPSELRKQTSYYGEALARHELKNSNKVESWREALVKAGNLPGWDLRTMANGHEAKAIKRIRDDISHKLLRMMTRTEASAEVSARIDLIGVDTRMQELKSFLKVGSGGVHMVGICGMWGSGKSTLASSIYNNIRHEFEGCCFVKNVRAESRMRGLKTLQETILSNVLRSKMMLKSIEQGIYEMERRLSQNCVLIVLDDVDHMDHLNMLAGSENWFGNGSRIIITTRNQDLLNAHNVIIRNVRLLDVKEATELFSRHAFGQSKPVQGLEDVSLLMVSKYLGGHPLALISLGSFLHGKEKSEWMSLLERLTCCAVDEILKKLETPDDGVARNIVPRFLTL